MPSKFTFAHKWAFGMLAFLAILIGTYAFMLYGSPASIREQPFVMGKKSLPELWYAILWLHALCAGVGLAIGWLQFRRRLRLRRPLVHRTIGILYTVMIIVGGVTGLYLSWYADGGWIAKAGFAMLSSFWLFTLYRSLYSLFIDREPVEHGRWMIRNYALSCAAISLRVYIPLGAVLFGYTDTNDTFGVIAWLCWLPNLLIAEAIIRRMYAVKMHGRASSY
ncbi:DUF2306 domain-containing protein [Paenibacillus taiwanensis]|uniref:DUF2306 domain-containing protein n=1 Tax=Paenibacillus taiwanensis TaxID=401638 RepID=UPI000428ECFD|nr:DUF2306 domain-containing protein [Paenibacillus taiwanensis]